MAFPGSTLYENIKSRVKCNKESSDELSCCLGVGQCECLSLFYLQYLLMELNMFSMYTAEGVYLTKDKLFLLLYVFPKHLRVFKKDYSFVLLFSTLYLSSLAIILMGKKELIALL